MGKAPGGYYRQGISLVEPWSSVGCGGLVLDDIEHLVGRDHGDGAAFIVVGQEAVDALFWRLDAHRLDDQASFFAVPKDDFVGRHGGDDSREMI